MAGVVAGVDGARLGGQPGWAMVGLRGGALASTAFHASFRDVLAEAEAAGAEVIAVDIPIGHEDPDGKRNGGRRACDLAARAWLGPRRASVFLVPPLDVLSSPTYAQARALARGRGVLAPSAQVWGLRAAIAEVGVCARADGPVREVHPEAAFQAMLQQRAPGAHLARAKRTLEGLNERLALLHAEGLRPARSTGGGGRLSPDDVLDATAAAWSAARIAEGRALTFPAEPPRDPRTGRPVAIWR